MLDNPLQFMLAFCLTCMLIGCIVLAIAPGYESALATAAYALVWGGFWLLMIWLLMVVFILMFAIATS